ncbi:fimbrial adapter PapK [Serratia sp. DD3]|nr:fimbrial adapter PapK [Serratia sp. DD3]
MQYSARVIKFIMAGLAILMLSLSPAHAESNSQMQFSGELFDRPCTIDNDSLQQEVIFPTRPYRDFWVLPAKTPSVAFAINLVHCYASTLGKLVKITFRGTTESALPGYVAVQGNNAGKLAIGIIDTDGQTLLPIGTVTGQGLLVNSDQVRLPFKAFVQATSEAVQNRSVAPGVYMATVQFELSYQ